jgi:hypothetical protein
MDVWLIADGGVEQKAVEELELLIALQEGLVWVDIPTCDQEGVRVLSEVFGFHPMAVRDCVERNQVPKVHAYSDHVFIVLHAPERGRGGNVHYVELDQFVGPGFLVTVHGPLDQGSTPTSPSARPAPCAGGWSRGGCDRPRRSSCPTRSSPPWLATRRASWPPWPRRRDSWSSG